MATGSVGVTLHSIPSKGSNIDARRLGSSVDWKRVGNERGGTLSYEDVMSSAGYIDTVAHTASRFQRSPISCRACQR